MKWTTPTLGTLLLVGVACSSTRDPVPPGGESPASGGSNNLGGSGGSGGVSATGGSANSSGGAPDSGGATTPGPGLGSGNPAGQIASMVLTDTAGTRYDAAGRPLDSGGSALAPLPGYNQFWFAWSIFNHDSEIFNRPNRVRTASLQAEPECAVPCDQIVLGCPGTDCIPALTNPERAPAGDKATQYLAENSYVVGVAVAGEARAYPHNVLWWHEIVNDVVGGVPIAVTHCPLTFSSLGHDPTKFIAGQSVELGVSGRLFNSNLVFYNRGDDTWFSQLLGVGTKGPALGAEAPRTHVWEMTWAAWKTLFPESTVLTSNTGHARDYEQYPYGNYFVDDTSTFRPTNPAPDPTYPNKDLTYGIRIGQAAKAYVHKELASWARTTYGDKAPAAGVVNDTVGGVDLAVVFDIDAGYVQAFDTTSQGKIDLARSLHVSSLSPADS